MPVKDAKAYYAAHKKQFKKYNRNAYLRNKPQRYARQVVRRAKLQATVNTLKRSPCMDCHKRFDPRCMEYDHRDPTTKRCSIAHMVAQTYRIREIVKEIEKCDLVCSNCHALRTWRQRHDS